MKILFLIIILPIFSLSLVDARAGCFLEDTIIHTPSGNKKIQDLISGDEVMTYNMTHHQPEAGTIGGVVTFASDGYYIINSTIKVTAEHPFYTYEQNQIVLKKTKDLKIGDMFISLEGNTPIKSIFYVSGEVKVYNILDVSPNHNYFAHDILVHNKGGGGGGGSSGGGGSRSSSSYNGPCYQTNSVSYNTSSCVSKRKRDDIRSIFLVAVLSILRFGVTLFRKFWGFVTAIGLRGKFTHDQGLIAYTKTICPDFDNKYSISYTLDDQIWKKRKIGEELKIDQYSKHVSIQELTTHVRKIFMHYQTDWTHKKRDSMTTYTTEGYFKKQKKIFDDAFGQGRDIIYNPEIESITPIKLITKSGDVIIRCQINAAMTNFGLNKSGKIITGYSNHKSFTEYRDMLIESNSSIKLANIRQSK